MTEAKIKRGNELIEWIKKYENDIRCLDEKVVIKINFESHGGYNIVKLRSQAELIDMMVRIVKQDFQARVLKLKNELEAL